VDECKERNIKPIGRQKFYYIFSAKIYQQSTRQTCMCSQCLEHGDANFDSLRILIKDICSDFLVQAHLDAVDNLQHIMKWHFKALIQRESVEVRCCATFALSHPDIPEFRHPCSHIEPHQDTIVGLQGLDELFHSLWHELTAREFKSIEHKENAEWAFHKVHKGLQR
jgi:hypothetical protein